MLLDANSSKEHSIAVSLEVVPLNLHFDKSFALNDARVS